MRGKNSPQHFNTGNASYTLERAHSLGKEACKPGVKMTHAQPILWSFLILLALICGCVMHTELQNTESNETIITPYGDIVLLGKIPSPPEKASIYNVTKTSLEIIASDTPLEESGPRKGLPICFNATEEWSIQTIQNHTRNAEPVIRTHIDFTNDSPCHGTYVDLLDVELGIARPPGTQEYASAYINNGPWKETYEIRLILHTLNETGTARILPLGNILENLNLSQSVTRIEESQFPLVIHTIHSGYFHRFHETRCEGIELWEPAWILYGNSSNGTPITLWLESADHNDIDRILTPPPVPPRIPGIFIHEGGGVHHWIPPDTHEYAILEKEIRIIVGDIATECPCSSTPEEIQRVRDTTLAIEVVYPNTEVIPFTMFNESYTFTLGNAIILPGDSLVYTGAHDACRWGMHFTSRDTKELGNMALKYVSTNKSA